MIKLIKTHDNGKIKTHGASYLSTTNNPNKVDILFFFFIQGFHNQSSKKHLLNMDYVQ